MPNPFLDWILKTDVSLMHLNALTAADIWLQWSLSSSEPWKHYPPAGGAGFSRVQEVAVLLKRCENEIMER